MAFKDRSRAVAAATLGLLGYYGAVVAVALPVMALLPDRWFAGPGAIAAGSLPLVAAALLANWVWVRRGWTSWRTLGWDVGRGPRSWGVGTLVGMGLALVALALVLLGDARVQTTGEAAAAYVARGLAVAALLLPAALSEELLFRGYPLSRLSRAAGRVTASIALALVFALTHLVNPARSAFGLVNIGLASLMLSAAFFTRGGLWVAWGTHFGWNTGLALLADAPVSGIRFEVPALEYLAGTRDWVTGGAFGPEGGLAATVAMGAGLGLFVTIIRRDEEREHS